MIRDLLVYVCVCMCLCVCMCMCVWLEPDEVLSAVIYLTLSVWCYQEIKKYIITTT